MIRFLFVGFLCLSYSWAFGQFDPAGGEPGSLAVHSSSGRISGWAEHVMIHRGWQNVADTLLGKSDLGDSSQAEGPVDGSVVSLGDGGSATVFLSEPLVDLEGSEFAVFENGFYSGDGYFLELAFVEVSRDGVTWKRFPSVSMADTTNQINGFSTSKPQWYQHLAGKHQAPFGTPFDLKWVGMDSILFIRIIDVVGSLNPNLGSQDSKGTLINDPYPTYGGSSGFDLDAIAFLKPSATVAQWHEEKRIQQVFVGDLWMSDSVVTVHDLQGNLLFQGDQWRPRTKGMYTITEENNETISRYRVLVL